MSETDRRLKDHLNGDQTRRERMCLELLATDRDFSDVRPRLPNGGPDGGRDIEAMHKSGARTFGAVGFVNNATDTREHRAKAKRKFNTDLERAIEAASIPTGNEALGAFVFFTNVGLTPAIKTELIELAIARGISICTIYDREDIRMKLDRTKGYGIRIRYLDIILSDAEQKEFFADWGERVQQLVSENLPTINDTTKRLLFLSEAQLHAETIIAVVELECDLVTTKGYPFFFETNIFLQVHSSGLTSICFGRINEAKEENNEYHLSDSQSMTSANRGYQFFQFIPGFEKYQVHSSLFGDALAENEEDWGPKWLDGGGSHSSIDVNSSNLVSSYSTHPLVLRGAPTCRVIELDQARIVFGSNRKFAEKIKSIRVYANNYLILDLSKPDLHISRFAFSNFRVPEDVRVSKDAYEWVRIRPHRTTTFRPNFTKSTPSRF